MSEVKLAEKLGIKETKEAVDGVMQMAMVLVLVLKDGAQLGDIASVIEKISTDEIMRQKMQAAMDGITKVPAEMGDCSALEGLELACQMGAYAPQLLAILQKKAA